MPPADASGTVGAPRLLFGVLGGMFAWSIHLLVGYAAVPYICGTTREYVLHLLTGAMAAVGAGAVGAAWSALRRLRGASPPPKESGSRPGAREWGSDPPAEARLVPPVPAVGLEVQSFLAWGGVVISSFFLALILVEALPAVLQGEPCRFIPTLDSPIIFLEGEGDVGRTLAAGGLIAARHRFRRELRGAVRGALAAPLPFLVPAGLSAHGRGPVGPGELWFAWNGDLWVLAGLSAATLLYVRGVSRLWRRAGRGRGISRRRAGAYLAGIYALFLALVSPVDALGETLFSAHMVQHMLLMVVAAPLLVLGRPGHAALWALPAPWRRKLGRGWRRLRPLPSVWAVVGHPVVVLFLHVGALWIWHVPGFYEAALRSRWVHHLEHASFFLTALLFWWALAQAGGHRRWPGYGAGILYVFGTALQSGALGALITFAPRPWYGAHETGAAAWNLELLADQQLAGIIMWVPVSLVYAAAAVALFVAWLREAEQAVRRRERIGWNRLPLPQDPEGGSGQPDRQALDTLDLPR